MDKIWKLVRRRNAAKISINKLAGLAGMYPNHLADVLQRKVDARPETLNRISRALHLVERGLERTPASNMFNLCLVVVCMDAKEDPMAVLAQDPGDRRTLDPVWLARARLRQRAVYLAHAVCGLPQREVAKAAGVTPAAVSLAKTAIEAERDPDNDDPLFEMVEKALGVA